MNENPMDKLRVLVAQVTETIESIPGLKMVNSGFGVEREMDIFQFTIRIDPAVVFAPEPILAPDDAIITDKVQFDAEQEAFNAQFETLIADEKQETEDAAFREAAKNLRNARDTLRDLRPDEGLGFDG